MASFFRLFRIAFSAALIYWCGMKSGSWETLAMLAEKPQELQMVLANYRPAW